MGGFCLDTVDDYMVYGNICFTFFTVFQVVAIQVNTVRITAVRREGCEAFL